MTRIKAIATHVPEYTISPENLISWFEKQFEPAEGRKIRHLVNESLIERKYSVVPDFLLNRQEAQLYRQNGQGINWPSLKERMGTFEDAGIEMGVKVGQKSLDKAGINPEEVTHFIAVSCTGLSAPGPEIIIPEKLGIRENIERNAVNFMGCYAAFHAMRMADRICRTEPESRVLIVCSEACSLHFFNDPSTDNLLASSLFSDGAAAILMTPEEQETGWLNPVFDSALIREGREDMGWHIGAERFEMTLSSKVAGRIKNKISDFIGRISEKAGVKSDEFDYYALHPGGKSILNAAIKGMKVQEEKADAAFDVLRKFGNMSSPSILFVLQQIQQKIENSEIQHDHYNILASAFGPGLTLEGAVLQYKPGV